MCNFENLFYEVPVDKLLIHVCNHSGLGWCRILAGAYFPRPRRIWSVAGSPHGLPYLFRMYVLCYVEYVLRRVPPIIPVFLYVLKNALISFTYAVICS